MLLWRYFVDVINVYHQCTLSNRDYLGVGKPHPIRWRSKEQKLRFLKKQNKTQILLCDCIFPVCSIDFNLANPHNYVSQILKLHFIYVWGLSGKSPAIVNITRRICATLITNLAAKGIGLKCTCVNNDNFTVLVSGGSRCHWVSTCTVWPSQSKWLSV